MYLAAAALIVGCAAETRHSVLTFFFDGVPDPEAEGEGDQPLVRRTPRGVTFFIHKPYLEGECSQCHLGQSGALMSPASVPADLCKQCHAEVIERPKILHGPLAVGACDQCHAPHRSTVPALLKAPPRELCLKCHSLFDLGSNVAAHQDPHTDCTSCHNPHGGDEPSFLRVSFPVAVDPHQIEGNGGP